MTFASSGQVTLRDDFDLGNELENNSVNTVFQDHRGTVWIGKQNGLVQYNGVAVKPIKGNSPEAKALRNSIINKVIETPDHILWIAAQGFLFQHNPVSGKTKAFPVKGSGLTMAYDLALSTDSSLWVSITGGIWHIEQGEITDTLFIDTPGALSFYCGPNNRAYLQNIFPNPDLELPFVMLPHDPVFKPIGPMSPEWHHRQTRVNAVLTSIMGDSLLRGPNEYRLVWTDTLGRWFISSARPNALHVWDPSSNEQPQKLLSTSATNLSTLGNGEFWISALTAGLARGRLTSTNYHEVQVLNSKGEFLSPIHSHFASDGHIYIGTPEGLFRLNKTESKSWKQDSTFALFENSSIAHIHEKNGSLYLSDRDGLWIWPLGSTSQETSRRITLPSSTTTDRVYKYVETSSGDFITTRTGVYPVRSDSVLSPLPRTNNWLNYDVLFSSASGSLWVAAREGIAQFKKTGASWHFDTIFSPENGGSANNMTLYENERGIWATSMSSGLFFYDFAKKAPKIIPIANADEDQLAVCMISDEKGRMWITSTSGVSVAMYHNDSIEVLAAVGLPEGDYWQNGVSALPNGQLLLHHDQSIVFFDPNKFAPNTNSPGQKSKWFIEGFEVNNKEATPPKGAWELSPSTRQWAVQLGFNKHDPTQVLKLRYKLIGHDEHWNHLELNDPLILFNGLRTGKYTLVIEASDIYGRWRGDSLRLPVRMMAPYYERWWFIISVLFLMVGAGLGIGNYLQRVKSERKMRALELKASLDRERSRISRDLHDHVGAHLTSIANKIDVLHLSTEEVPAEKLERVGNETRTTIGLLRETIWALNRDSFTPDTFMNKVRDYCSRLFDGQIKLVVTEAYQVGTVEFGPTLALNLFRIVQEAAQNCLKHSKATEFKVQLSTMNGKYTLDLSDNGIGSPALSDEGEGYGLSNMRYRAEEINGTIEFCSASNEGFAIRVVGSFEGVHQK